jgi:serine/threonine-protein kinase
MIPPRLEAALADRYRLESPLGEGGMATVYRAQDVRHGRTVAVKVLRPELAAVIGAERFLTEIRTTAGLQHPHILPLFDSGEADGYLYYVMPHVAGESLRDRLERERQLPVDEAVSIARDVADALGYAHRQGIVHRDVKPANILLHEGRPLVADFGIALAVSAAGEGRLTETGLSLGTPWYMSPEQASAERELSARSDVYSLGAVLYEMLAGQPPFPGPSAQVVLARLLTEEPADLTRLRRTVPAHVDAAVRRALERLPADRFGTAGEFAEALSDPGYRYETAYAHAPPPGRSASPAAGRAAAPGDRHPAALLALGALSLVLAVVAALGWMRDGTAPDSGGALTLRLEAPGVEFGPLGYAVSRDGSQFAVAGTSGGLRVRSAADPVLIELPGTEGAFNPQFSADGQSILFARDGGIQRVPARGGDIRTVVPAPPDGPIVQTSVADDGTVAAGGPGGTFLVRPGAAEPERLDDGILGNYRNPHLLPDASGLIVTQLTADGPAIVLLDLQRDTLIDLGLTGWRPQYSRTGHLLYVDPAGTLVAAPFDLDGHRVGEPRVPLQENVSLGPETASFVISGGGVLLFGRGGDFASGDILLDETEISTGERIGPLPLPIGSYEDGRYSPDGSRLVLELGISTPQIHVLDLEFEALSQLTFEGSSHQPIWSPDGSRLGFTTERGETDGEEIWVRRADGSGPAERLFAPGRGVHIEAWPSDSIALVSWEGIDGASRYGLLSTDPDLGIDTLPYDANEVRDVAVSPDGRWLAYTAADGSSREVFVRPFPTGEGLWRISDGEGADPRWGPDRRTLYYVAREGVVAADLRFDPAPVVTGRRPVAPFPADPGPFTFWDVHPDGERFVVGRITGGETAGQALYVVVDWPALLPDGRD